MKGLLFFIMFSLSVSLFSSTNLGFYLAPINSSSSFNFSNTGFSKTQSYIKNDFMAFFSIYSENGFEGGISISFDKYLIEDPEDFASRFSCGLELGKVFSTDFSINGKKFFVPDISSGLFIRMYLFSPEGESDMFFSYGIYFMVRSKIVIQKGSKGIYSLDIGYKLYLPFHFDYYNGSPYSIQSYTSSIFIGVSI